MLLCYNKVGDNMKRFLIGLGNFIVTPIFFGCISFLIVAYGVNKAFSYQNIKETIKTTIEENIKKDEENNILNKVYDKGEKYGFSKEEVNSVLEDKTVQEVLSKYIYTNLKGEKVNITDEEINEIIDVISNKTERGSNISSETKEKIKFSLKDNLKEVETISVNNNISGENEKIQEILVKYTGKSIRIKAIILTVISAIIIVLLNLKNFVWIKEIFKLMLSSGLTLYILCLSIKPVVSRFVNDMVAGILERVFNPVKLYSLVVFIIALLGYIIYYIGNKITDKRKEQIKESI